MALQRHAGSPTSPQPCSPTSGVSRRRTPERKACPRPQSPVSRKRHGSLERPTEDQNRGAIRPKSRRAFGCVTWVNIAMLVFLATAFLLPLPLRYVGNGEIFSEIQLRL